MLTDKTHKITPKKEGAFSIHANETNSVVIPHNTNVINATVTAKKPTFLFFIIDGSVKLVHHAAKRNKYKSKQKDWKSHFEIFIQPITDPARYSDGAQKLQTQAAIFQKGIIRIFIGHHFKKKAAGEITRGSVSIK